MPFRTLPLSAALAGLCAAPALALDPFEFGSEGVERGAFEGHLTGSETWEAWDRDGDGALGEAERGRAMRALMDLDGDGTLTIAEWDEWVDTRLGRESARLSVAAWDMDGDGRIDAVEFGTAAETLGWYGRYDVDGDGRWDLTEFTGWLYDIADADGDGVITDEEYRFGAQVD